MGDLIPVEDCRVWITEVPNETLEEVTWVMCEKDLKNNDYQKIKCRDTYRNKSIHLYTSSLFDMSDYFKEAPKPMTYPTLICGAINLSILAMHFMVFHDMNLLS